MFRPKTPYSAFPVVLSSAPSRVPSGCKKETKMADSQNVELGANKGSDVTRRRSLGYPHELNNSLKIYIDMQILISPFRLHRVYIESDIFRICISNCLAHNSPCHSKRQRKKSSVIICSLSSS